MVKSARQALGDNGKAQRYIKTIHGRGFRFVGNIIEPASATVSAPETQERPERETLGRGQPSIAVLRFARVGDDPVGGALAQALPAELIAGLSRMKWLHVIARGSSFRFDPQGFDPSQVADELDVGYILTGLIEPLGTKLAVSLELQVARDGALVWSDRLTFEANEIQIVRGEIVGAAISALEINIPQEEARRSRALTANQFDAWSHFHLALTHAFRFREADNHRAAAHFRRALDLDPDFGRAHAGLSFIHWQNAFMRLGASNQAHVDQALAEAKHALNIDPFGNFCMRRALWLSGDAEASLAWLDRGLMINPNYAHCHYTKGMMLNMRGEYARAGLATTRAMALSPLDPLYYGMLANKTLSEIAQGILDGAMELAERSVNSPGTYYYPVLWAAIAAELSGQKTAMARWRDRALAEWPDASIDAMLQTFPLEDPDLVNTVTGALRRMGIP